MLTLSEIDLPPRLLDGRTDILLLASPRGISVNVRFHTLNRLV